MRKTVANYAIFVDCETGGLNWRIHPLIELGAVVVDRRSFKILEGEKYVFSRKIKPSHGQITAKSAEITGYTPELWKDADPLPLVMRDFVAFVMQFKSKGTIFAGHNSPFDMEFVADALYRSGLDKPFTDYHLLDTYSVADGVFGPNGPKRPSMEVIARLVGVKEEPKVHRAINGALFAAQLYVAMKKFKN